MFEFNCTMTIDGKRCNWPVRRPLSDSLMASVFPKDGITFGRHLCETHIISLDDFSHRVK